MSLTRKDLETLFAPLFDDSFSSRAPDVSTSSPAQPDNILMPDTPTPATTTIANDEPPIKSPTTAEQIASNTDNAAEDLPQQSVPELADYDPNVFFNPFAPAPTVPDIAESSTHNLDPSNMHTFYQHHPSTHHWT